MGRHSVIESLTRSANHVVITVHKRGCGKRKDVPGGIVRNPYLIALRQSWPSSARSQAGVQYACGPIRIFGIAYRFTI